MRIALFSLAVVVAATILAGCGSGPPLPQHREDEWHAPVQILLRYVNKDGTLTRAELEKGLRRDFDAADLNHDGVLEPDEMRAVNQQRWKDDQSAISPLQDWNGDGVVDFSEFAANARPLFRQHDRSGDGVLTLEELHPGRAAGAPNQGGNQGQQEERRGGPPGGGGRGGGPQE